MKRKTKIILLAVLAAVIVIPVLLIVLAMLLMASKDSGSPKLAAHWREQISTYPTPREAKAAEARIAVHEFENGEWVFGLAQNSHGGLLHGGGHSCGERQSR